MEVVFLLTVRDPDQVWSEYYDGLCENVCWRMSDYTMETKTLAVIGLMHSAAARGCCSRTGKHEIVSGGSSRFLTHLYPMQ